MKSFLFNPSMKEALFVGAHCDDVEIGCGGTLLALAQARPDVTIRMAVFSGAAGRSEETRAALGKLLSGTRHALDIYEFRDGFFPHDWLRIKEQFERLKAQCSPDVVFTHYSEDRHQDHRILGELTWNTFRSHPILEFEIPKYDGDLGRPNFYVPLSAQHVRRKVEVLLESFPSQGSKPWFTEELFLGLMRLRGMECNAASGYAEAYHARKFAFEW